MATIQQMQQQAIQQAVQQQAKQKAALQQSQASKEQRDDLSAKYLESVQKEADTAAQAPARLEQAQREGIAATRADTGRVLANARGMLGGGRGMAVMRGAALQRGSQEGAQRAQYAGQIQTAMQEAARAKSEALAEQGKAQQAKQLEQQNAQIAATKAEETARALAEDYFGWLSDANRSEIAANLRAKAAQQLTPAEQQAWLDMADDVERGRELGQIG